ncbi:3-deoxy-manno-octulosonate cytidylyltransferase [Galdieria sulphuraria]|nr:3-deoxy-manno-octulosonate cytidylyltransferase [Galdieria sulphuraria]
MLTPVSVLAVIPARFGSTRFPGKPLALLRSVPIIVWVHRAVKRAKLVDRVLVATDNTDIANEIRKQGGLAYLTSPHCSCGTIRVVEAVKLFYEREPQDWNRLSVIVNVQGDEPAVNPEHIDIAIESLLKDKDETNLQVVCNSKHEAMYFSRSPIPYKDANIAFPHPFYLRHVGIYAFRKSFLEMMPQLSTSPLEALERLEQLTWLYHQKKILVNVVQHAWRGIDRPEDLIFLEKHLPIQRNQE